MPHDWSIEGKTHPKNATGGGGRFFRQALAGVEKKNQAPEEWKAEKTAIYFEGIYMIRVPFSELVQATDSHIVF